MEGKLNPCPRCSSSSHASRGNGHGIVALQTDNQHKGQWQGACMTCGLTGPWCKSQKEAIDAWNNSAQK